MQVGSDPAVLYGNQSTMIRYYAYMSCVAGETGRRLAGCENARHSEPRLL